MAMREFIRTAATSESAIAAHMRQVFNYMTGGVALSGGIAYFLGTYNGGALLSMLVGSGLMWVLMLATLGLVFFLSFRVHTLQPATALGLFALYSAMNGAMLAPLVWAYTGASVATAFITAAGMFAAMSVYGYTTNRSLNGLGSFLFMGLIGIVIASVVNIFMQSSQMSFVISLLAVPLFAGMTAYDTQKIKEMGMAAGDDVSRSRMAVMGALQLYLDFINMFIHLLQLLGDRR
ncbi:MAG: Bax inhibitor-1/YccA family protein [Alphaproteobacteria bacterium]